MLLQSLVMAFMVDTKNLDKGVRESESGADDLTDAMKKAEAQSKKTAATIKSFVKGAAGYLGIALSASKTMSMAVQRAGEIDALDTLSLQLGTSITKTDALSRSIVGLGGSTQQAQADLGKLSDALKERGQKPLEGMLQLSDRLAGMSYDRATRELKEYGITEKSTIELLRKGGSEIERMIKHQERNGAITVEAAEKAKRFNESLRGLRQMSSDAANGFAQFLMPALTVALDALTKVGRWMQDNKPFVIGFFIGVSAILAKMFLPAMMAVAGTVIAATWPFIAIGAVIGAAAAAFAFIYDDIMTFVDGGESMIGMVLDKFPVIGEVVTWLWETMKLAFGSIVSLGESLLAGMSSVADGIVGVFKWLWDAIQSYIGFITDIVGKVSDVVGSVGGWFKDKLGIATEEKVTREVEDVYTGGDDSVSPSNRMSGVDFVDDDGFSGRRIDNTYNTDNSRSDATYNTDNSRSDATYNTDNSRSDATYNTDNSRAINEIINNTNIAKKHTEQAQQQPANAMTSNAINNRRTNNVEQNLAIGEITIETQATDAQGMASSTRSELQDQLQRMQADNATAITR